MSRITIHVMQQAIRVTTPTVIVSDTINYIEAKALFSPDWNGLDKWLHVTKEGEAYEFHFVNDIATGLDLRSGEYEIYIHGSATGKRIITNKATIVVEQAGEIDGEVLPPINPSAAEQITATANNALTIANSVKADADSGKFNGTSITHSWSGTTLTVTSASGTSSANLKGDKGADGVAGAKGDPFTYDDFTAEQLNALKGDKGDKGDAFTYEDFTETQLALLKGEKGDKGDTGATGSNYVITESDYRAIANVAADILEPNLNSKVDKVTGKGLSTNDYTTAAKSKVDAIPSNPKYTDTIYDDTEIRTLIDEKQEKLVSGTNIKTINNQSIIGNGNITIQSSGSSVTMVDVTNGVNLTVDDVTRTLPTDAIITDIKSRLDALEYVPIVISSFTVSPATAETSTTTSVTLSYSLNKVPTTLRIKKDSGAYESITTNKTGTITVSNISSKSTWTLEAYDEKTTVTKTVTVDFKKKIFYGVATDFSFDTLTSAFATNNTLSAKTLTVGSGKYIYFATSFANPTFVLGGFTTDFDTVGTQSRYGTSYTIYRSTRGNLGTTTLEVK